MLPVLSGYRAMSRRASEHFMGSVAELPEADIYVYDREEQSKNYTQAIVAKARTDTLSRLFALRCLKALSYLRIDPIVSSAAGCRKNRTVNSGYLLPGIGYHLAPVPTPSRLRTALIVARLLP
jgi:hypothetical protein